MSLKPISINTIRDKARIGSKHREYSDHARMVQSRDNFWLITPPPVIIHSLIRSFGGAPLFFDKKLLPIKRGCHRRSFLETFVRQLIVTYSYIEDKFWLPEHYLHKYLYECCCFALQYGAKFNRKYLFSDVVVN